MTANQMFDRILTATNETSGATVYPPRHNRANSIAVKCSAGRLSAICAALDRAHISYVAQALAPDVLRVPTGALNNILLSPGAPRSWGEIPEGGLNL